MAIGSFRARSDFFSCADASSRAAKMRWDRDRSGTSGTAFSASLRVRTLTALNSKKSNYSQGTSCCSGRLQQIFQFFEPVVNPALDRLLLCRQRMRITRRPWSGRPERVGQIEGEATYVGVI